MKRFEASQFTPTKFDTAEDKAKFANHFVRFVESGFKRTLFPKWFYTRLSMTFGHIAHYDIYGFYGVQFGTTESKVQFLKQTLNAGGWGDPAFTYSDVEKALAQWVREQGYVETYQRRSAYDLERIERVELARLKVKYPEAR